MTFEELCIQAPSECPICHAKKENLQLGCEAKRTSTSVVDLDYYSSRDSQQKTKEIVEYVITLFCPRCKRLVQFENVYGNDEMTKTIQLAYAIFINRREKINGDFVPSEETLPNLQLVRFFNGDPNVKN